MASSLRRTCPSACSAPPARAARAIFCGRCWSADPRVRLPCRYHRATLEVAHTVFTNDLRQARVDLAAVLRWSARLGYQTGTCNHFSFMAPGRDDLFLVNPEGYFWSEITASSLLLCTLDGEVVEGSGTVERTAFSLHAPIHRLKPEARACFHT